MVKILYEDNHLLVVVKPPDIPVQADISGALDLLNLLKGYLKEKYNKPGEAYLGLVHRLDRPTGGVMVFAKTSKAAGRLSEQIRERLTGKTYLAVVSGIMTEKEGAFSDWLLKDTRTNMVKIVPPHTNGAKDAVLGYRVLEEREGLSLVSVRLLTGRGHQIRVQMAHHAAPIVGDRRYGKETGPGPFSSSQERGKGLTQNPEDNESGRKGQGPEEGMALWAYELSFAHPVKKEELIFSEPPPAKWPWNLFEVISSD